MRVLKSLLLFEEATKKGGIVSPKEIYEKKVLIFLFVVKYYIKLFYTMKKLERIEQTNRETEIEQ